MDTSRKRTKILTLHEHAAKTEHRIAKEVGVRYSTVCRITRSQQGSLPPSRKRICGRKSVTTARE